MASQKWYKPYTYCRRQRTLRISRNLHALWKSKRTPIFYKPPRTSRHLLSSYASLLRNLRYQNGLYKLLQASYMICGSQNGFSVHLKASYTLSWSQHGLSKAIQDSYTTCSQNTFSTHVQSPTRFSVVKTDSPNIYSRNQNELSEVIQASYTFAVAITDSSNF